MMSDGFRGGRFRPAGLMALATVLAAALAALPVIATGAAEQAAGQQDSVLQVDPLRPLSRPLAVFDHDAHNEKAKVEECGACHHGGEGLKRNPAEETPGIPCSQCHQAERNDGGTRLVLAYHRQCMGCHEAQGKGPLACGECHPKSR